MLHEMNIKDVDFVIQVHFVKCKPLMSDKLIKMILLLYYEEKKNDFLLQAISNFLFDFVFQSVLPLLVCCLAGKIFFSKKALYSKANFNKLLFGKIIKSIHSPNVCP